MAEMSRIFISYRREDTQHAVGRLTEDLGKHFAEGQVFTDVTSIDPGIDFEEALEKGLDTCAAMLVVIGPKWVAVSDRQARRRLDSPDDWVRQEVAESLRRPGVRVFPVLVDDAEMPSKEELPADLWALVRRQAFPLTVRHWRNDVERLIAFLKKVPGLSQAPEPEAKSPNDWLGARGAELPATAVASNPGRAASQPQARPLHPEEGVRGNSAPAEAEQEQRKRADVAAKREAEEVQRLNAEVEAKRTAEEEQRKGAEVAAKREAEEVQRLNAEVEAKRTAEEEQRKRAEVAAKREAEEVQRLNAEVEAKRTAEEEQRKGAEVAAKREAEEQRERADVEAKRNTDVEQSLAAARQESKAKVTHRWTWPLVVIGAVTAIVLHVFFGGVQRPTTLDHTPAKSKPVYGAESRLEGETCNSNSDCKGTMQCVGDTCRVVASTPSRPTAPQ